MSDSFQSPAVTSSRRRFIHRGCGALAAAWVLPASGQTEGVGEIVDTHTHFYDPSRAQGVPWPQPGSPLYRTVLPKDWKKLAAPLGIHKTVVVEASKWVEDNQWILDLAKEEKCIVGFVGNLDPGTPDFAAHLKRFAANPVFRGIRVGSTSLAQGLGKPEYMAGLKLLSDRGLSLDINGGGALLESVDRLAMALPELRIVIDHVGGAGDAAKISDAWKQGIKAAARHQEVYCKVSALAEQAKSEPGQAPRETAYYLPVLDHVWHAFGEDRLLFGSNWPVSDRGAPFETVYRIVKEYFAGKGAGAEGKYFGGNSRRVYRWIDRV